MEKLSRTFLILGVFWVFTVAGAGVALAAILVAGLAALFAVTGVWAVVAGFAVVAVLLAVIYFPLRYWKYREKCMPSMLKAKL
jgi:hypothetical protein